MASASSASFRESEGRALSGVPGAACPWAGGLGDAVPQKLITFSRLKDPKSLLQFLFATTIQIVKVVIVN